MTVPMPMNDSPTHVETTTVPQRRSTDVNAAVSRTRNRITFSTSIAEEVKRRPKKVVLKAPEITRKTGLLTAPVSPI